jgi:hypothetical protein
MSDSFKWHAAPSGDSCLVLEFASVLSLHANRRAASAAAALNHARDLGRLVGLTDIVPGMVTVGVHYRPEHIPVPAGVATPYGRAGQRSCGGAQADRNSHVLWRRVRA